MCFIYFLDPGDKNQENGGFNLTEGQQNTHNSNKNDRAWTLLILFLLDIKIDSLNGICCFSFCVVKCPIFEYFGCTQKKCNLVKYICHFDD